ncbi:MAG: acyltransferase family protein [Corynebacterium sp.]|nr:acyltransferase family protein [Corynebacterium sp.]
MVRKLLDITPPTDAELAELVDKSQPTTTQKPRFKIRRVLAIDGLRGLAVLVVVLYHFFHQAAPGGFMGVDMFFVLSGFLITSLLLREQAVTDRINLLQFWKRRVRRIFPAAFTVLFVVTAIAGIIGGDAAVGLFNQFLGTIFFANNWVQIAGSESYFADSGVQIFAHYWSLAVEEQFYVIFPLIFILLAKLQPKIAKTTIVALILISFALMLRFYDPAADPTRVYYGTDTHSFGLLIGVLVAYLTTTTNPAAETDSWPVKILCNHAKLTTTTAVVAFILLLLMVFTVADTSAFTYRGGLLLASILTAIVLTTLLIETGPIHAIMVHPVLRWLGERSFSLYLWHWPIVVLIKQLTLNNHMVLSQWTIGAIAFALSIPISHYSYMWIETPIRRNGYRGLWKKNNNLRRGAFALVAVGTSVFAATAVAVSPTKTALEQELTTIAQEQAPKHREITAIPAAENTDVMAQIPGPQLTPPGDRITAIGDSVMLASTPALQERFPGIYVDAQVSRTLIVAPGIVQQLKDAGRLDPFIVLGFGTNAELDTDKLQEVMNIVGPHRMVVMVLPYGDRQWIPKSQEAIIQAQDIYPNLFVADWCQRAMANKALLHTDLIHPGPEGTYQYANSVSYAFQQWANHRKRPVAQCGV